MGKSTNNFEFEYSMAIRQGDEKCIKRLMRRSAKPPQGALRLALAHSHPELLGTLILAGANPNDRDGAQVSPLGLAIRKFDAEVVETLIKAGADPNIETGGLLPLVLADLVQPELVPVLLRFGADPNRVQTNGVTPLWSAVERGEVASTRLLLVAGANPKVRGPDGQTAFELAKSRRQSELIELVRQFASRHVEPDIESPGQELLEGLHRALQTGDLKGIYATLDAGADPEAELRGYTALERALQQGSIQAVSELIKRGVDLNRTSRGVCPLESALRAEKDEIAAVLLNAGAQPHARNANCADPFMTACMLGKLRLVRLFLKKGADPNVQEKSGRTPLMEAASKRNPKLLRLLLQEGASLEVVHHYTGWTALFFAVVTPSFEITTDRSRSEGILMAAEPQSAYPDQDRVEIVHELLKQGSAVNHRDLEGRTVLGYAQTPGVAQELLRRGADLSIRDKQGRSMKQWLDRNGLTLLSNTSEPRILSKKAAAFKRRRRPT